MKVKAFRAGFIASVVAAVAMAGASSAWACEEPRIHISDTSVEPGDPIPFTLSNSQLGATVDVSVEGYPVLEDLEDTTPRLGYKGTFTMPDRGGASRSMYVTGVIMHTDDSAEHVFDGPWPTHATLQFIRPGPPSDAPPARDPTPVPAPTEAPERQRAPADTKPSTPGGGSHSPGSGPAGPATPGPPSTPVNPADPSGSPLPELTAAADSAAESSSRATAREQSRRPAAAGPVRRPRQVERRVGTPLTLPDETPAVPSTFLVGIALIVLIGAAFAMVRLLRRGGASPGGGGAPRVPPWIPPDVRREAWARDVLIEAELQELIAEERARELAADKDGAPAAPG